METHWYTLEEKTRDQMQGQKEITDSNTLLRQMKKDKPLAQTTNNPDVKRIKWQEDNSSEL